MLERRGVVDALDVWTLRQAWSKKTWAFCICADRTDTDIHKPDPSAFEMYQLMVFQQADRPLSNVAVLDPEIELKCRFSANSWRRSIERIYTCSPKNIQYYDECCSERYSAHALDL